MCRNCTRRLWGFDQMLRMRSKHDLSEQGYLVAKGPSSENNYAVVSQVATLRTDPRLLPLARNGQDLTIVQRRCGDDFCATMCTSPRRVIRGALATETFHLIQNTDSSSSMSSIVKLSESKWLYRQDIRERLLKLVPRRQLCVSCGSLC